MKKITNIFAVASVVLMVLAGGFYAAGARVNTTKSIPIGLYWAAADPVQPGAYVMWCPVDGEPFASAKERGYIGAGFCQGSYGYMMKRILAAKGDRVTVSESGVLVNGEEIPLSKPLTVDAAGRKLPVFRIENHELKAGELLLMSDVSGTSFDGRYYGLVDAAQVTTVIKPVFVW